MRKARHGCSDDHHRHISTRACRAAPKVSRTQRECSFDAMLPDGWEGWGRTRRMNLNGLVTCQYSARKDKDGLTKVVVPGKIWQYADGALVGMMLLGAMGTRKFSAAREIGPELITREFKRGKTQLRVAGATEAPEYFARLYGELASIGLDPRTAEFRRLACPASTWKTAGAGATKIHSWDSARRRNGGNR